MKNSKPCVKPTHRAHLPYHDYKERCIYHITLVCSDRVQVLGRIVGDSVENARCELTPLGAEVAMAIKNLPVMVARYGETVQVLAARCMPEHVHFVLFVKERMKDGLWKVMRGFKQGCNKRLKYWLEKSEEVYGTGAEGIDSGLEKPETPNGRADGTALDGSVLSSDATAGGGSDALPSSLAAFLRQLAYLRSERIKRDHALFEPNYDETRLRRKGQLKTMISYVHNNPMHRWLKQHYPGWLVPVRGIVIANRSYDAIGNVTLLGLPRWQVHVRRAWSEDEARGYKNECVVKARKGYALVSPFISKHEAAVRDVCLEEGHSVIVIVDNGFSEYAQCPGGLYEWCVEGQVLVLVPSELKHEDRKGLISRNECVWLNGLAEEICGEE